MPGIAANADKRVNSYPAQMLTNARREMSASLADVTGFTTCTQKFVDNARTEIERNRFLHTKHTTNLKRRKIIYD